MKIFIAFMQNISIWLTATLRRTILSSAMASVTFDSGTCLLPQAEYRDAAPKLLALDDIRHAAPLLGRRPPPRNRAPAHEWQARRPGRHRTRPRKSTPMAGRRRIITARRWDGRHTLLHTSRDSGFSASLRTRGRRRRYFRRLLRAIIAHGTPMMMRRRPPFILPLLSRMLMADGESMATQLARELQKMGAAVMACSPENGPAITRYA